MTANLNGLKVLLTDVVSAEELATHLEEIEYGYMMMLIASGDPVGGHVADDVYFLHLLRLALQNKPVI